jgi:hypothetical protein
MHIGWEPVEARLRSETEQAAQELRVDSATKARLQGEMRRETADIAAALVGLGQRLAAAGFDVVARAIAPDYWVKVGERALGIQVNFAGPSWLVMIDGVVADELVHVVDGERSFWARAAAADVPVDLGAYFAAQFAAFVTRVQKDRARPR